MFDRGEFESLEQMARKAKSDLLNQAKGRDEIDDLLEAYEEDFGKKDEEVVEEYNNASDSNKEELYDNGFENDPLPDVAPYDQALFKGGPTKLQIDTYKKQFRKNGIYLIEVANEPFIIRTMNRFEYKQIVVMQGLDGLLREEVICKTCTLWPENIDFKNLSELKAGVPSTLAEIIMERSGFTNEYTIQEI